MEIIPQPISSAEIIGLFSLHDDFTIDFLGEDSVYYTRYSPSENIEAAWIAYLVNLPVACIAYRTKTNGIGEVKRMFIAEGHRGQGLSKPLLSTVQDHAKSKNIHTLYLSTRITLEPAISLYRKFGFTEVFCKDLYVEMEKSI